MSEPMGDDNRAEEAALWRRFRALERNSGFKARDLGDPMPLAAYTEGRLGTKAAEAVEAYLAAKPESIGDILAAQAAALAAHDAPEAMIARAADLVAPRTSPAFDPRVVPFRQTPAAQSVAWHTTLSRLAIAASLIATGLVGFALGSNTYGNILQSHVSASADTDPLDQPAGFFSSEDSSS